MIPNAFSHRMYKKLALFIVAALVAGVNLYVKISGLPASHCYPRYLIAAFPVGIIFPNIFVAHFVFNPKRKWKWAKNAAKLLKGGSFRSRLRNAREGLSLL
jgi:hypothetical protein